MYEQLPKQSVTRGGGEQLIKSLKASSKIGSSSGAEWIQPQAQYFNMVGDSIVPDGFTTTSNSYSLSSALKQ